MQSSRRSESSRFRLASNSRRSFHRPGPCASRADSHCHTQAALDRDILFDDHGLHVRLDLAGKAFPCVRANVSADPFSHVHWSSDEAAVSARPEGQALFVGVHTQGRRRGSRRRWIRHSCAGWLPQDRGIRLGACSVSGRASVEDRPHEGVERSPYRPRPRYCVWTVVGRPIRRRRGRRRVGRWPR